MERDVLVHWKGTEQEIAMKPPPVKVVYCKECGKELRFPTYTLANYYPDYFPDYPRPECDTVWGVVEDGELKTYCSEGHARLSQSKV